MVLFLKAILFILVIFFYYNFFVSYAISLFVIFKELESIYIVNKSDNECFVEDKLLSQFYDKNLVSGDQTIIKIDFEVVSTKLTGFS